MIYLVVFIYLLVFVVKFDINKKVDGANFTYNLLLVVFIAIAGLRYKVGGDTLVYHDIFNDVPFLSNLISYDFDETRYDPLWIVLSSISKTIINDFAFFQIIHATIVNVIIFRFIKQNTVNRFTAVFFYYCGAYLYFNMEIMRESLAICVFLLGYQNFKEKKWIQFYIYALVAYFFHSSAMILFLFPLFQKLKFNSKGILIIIISLFLSTYLEPLIELGLFALKISEKFALYSTGTGLNIFGVIYGVFLYCIIPYFFIYFNKTICSTYNKYENLIYAYFFLTLLSFAVPGFYRFLNYILIFELIFLADFFINILEKEKDLLKIKILFVAFFLTIIAIPKIQYYLVDTSAWSKDTHKYNLYYPYSSIFTKEEYFYRQDIYDGTFYEE